MLCERFLKGFAIKCENSVEMIKPAESEGYDLTKEEAEAYLEELADFEMDEEALKQQQAVGIIAMLLVAASGTCKCCFVRRRTEDPFKLILGYILRRLKG